MSSKPTKRRTPMNIKDLIPEYLKYLKTVNRSYHTIRNAGFMLRNFAGYLEKDQIAGISGLCREVIEDYQQELAFTQTAQGKPLSVRTQVKRLCTVKGFTRFLKEKDFCVSDAGERIRLPKEPQCLPRSILTHAEINQMMNAPDMRTNTGFRDRVMLEILYDTAIRRAELSQIQLADLDLAAGFVKVCGKGDKERVVPVSATVCELINNYILAVRPALLNGKSSNWLIVNDKGDQIKVHTVWKNIKACARLAGLKKNITTHTFRHTCATHMLKNGAPIRHLQEMLGHESLESTQIYTHVTINDLKEIHARYHPGANMK